MYRVMFLAMEYKLLPLLNSSYKELNWFSDMSLGVVKDTSGVHRGRLESWNLVHSC